MPKLPPFEIIRASRRSISIQISKDCGLIVRAPFSVPEDIIHAFVDRKSDWIMKHMGKYEERTQEKSGSLYYFGKPNAFEYNLLQKEAVVWSDGFFTFSGKVRSGSLEQAALTKWYRTHAQLYMAERVAHFAGAYGLTYGQITITSALTRWGSCSGRNNLSFPWRLMMAPREVIDYVVVHELSHTVHKDHSPRFWGLVESIMPDWRLYRAHLREDGWRYHISPFGPDA